MAEKDSDSTDTGLDGNARNFGPEAVKYNAELVERMIRDLKLKRQRRNKDHDRDHDHPCPSVPQETDLVLTNEEELKFLRSKLKDWEDKQKLTPRASKMGEKNGDSNHPGLDNDIHDFGLAHVKSTVDLFERMIRDTKPRKERTKKDGDHDHPEPSGPRETDLVLMLEEQLKFLKSKMKSCEKEQQEPGTMEKKVSEALEQELIALVSQLEIPTKSVVGRICGMNKYEGVGTIDYDEFKTIRLAGEEKEENQKNHDELLAQLMGDGVFPDDGKGHSKYRKKNTNFRSQELKKIEENETKLEKTEAMQRSLDEFEKDQKELDTMEKKTADGIEQELVTKILQLQSSTKCLSERLNSMKMYKDSGSFDPEKLETIRVALENLQEYQKNPNGLLARMLRVAILPDNGKGNHEYPKSSTEFSSQELKKIKEEIETKLAALVEVQRSLAELEDKIDTDISTNGINKRGIFLSRLLVGFLFMYFLRRKKRALREGFNQIKQRVEINKFPSVVEIAEEALTSLSNLKTKIRVKDLKTLQYDEGVEILVRGMAELNKKTDISDKLEQLKTQVTTLNERLYELSDGKVNKTMRNLSRKINHIWEN